MVKGTAGGVPARIPLWLAPAALLCVPPWRRDTGSSLPSFPMNVLIPGPALLTTSSPDRFPKIPLQAASHGDVELVGDPNIQSRTGVILCGSPEAGGAARGLLTLHKRLQASQGRKHRRAPDSETAHPPPPRLVSRGLRSSSQGDLTGVRGLLTWPSQALQ